MNTFFQIYRQPDPYVSHCIDSWDKTEIQVPESINYSLTVNLQISPITIRCIVPLQLCQQMCHQKAIAEACNCYWPSLSIPSAGEFSTSFSTYNKYILTRLFSVTFSLHRTPCSIKLVDNPERDCYADVMALFDDEIMLFPKINCPLEINLNILQEMSLRNRMFWAPVPEQGPNNITFTNLFHHALF